METTTPPAPVSKAARVTGYVLSTLPVLMLLMSGSMKFIKPPGSEEGFAHLGWSLGLANGLGVLELGCVIVYLIPRTAVLGAILLTGYLGGAIATHVRVGDSVFQYSIIIVLGVLLWGGLYLRDPRLRALIPLKR